MTDIVSVALSRIIVGIAIFNAACMWMDHEAPWKAIALYWSLVAVYWFIRVLC